VKIGDYTPVTYSLCIFGSIFQHHKDLIKQ